MFSRSALPNSITSTRILIALTIAGCIAVQNSLLVVQVLAIVAIASDKLDGVLARAWHVESERGKQLESIADPLFNFVTGVYIITRIGFPAIPFWIGVTCFALTIAGRGLVYLRTGKFFAEKSPITRYGTVTTFAIVLLYLFNLPFREYVVYTGLAYGIIVTLNYMRMIGLFLRAHQKQQHT